MLFKMICIFIIGVGAGLLGAVIWFQGDVVYWQAKYDEAMVDMALLRIEYDTRLNELSQALGVDMTIGDVVVPLCHTEETTDATEPLTGCEYT